MNFLKDKVRKYQEKKLLEAEQKLKFHMETKSKLEKELKKIDEGNVDGLKKEIEKNNNFIKIWKKNIDSINKQIKKLGN